MKRSCGVKWGLSSSEVTEALSITAPLHDENRRSSDEKYCLENEIMAFVCVGIIDDFGDGSVGLQ